MKLWIGPMPPRTAGCGSPTEATANFSELRGRNGRLARERHRIELAPGSFGRAREELLAFRWFPPSFLRADVCDDGVTVVQRCRLGPFLSVDAPVRVVERLDAEHRVAVTVVTLRGHPERGVERYEIVEDQALGRTVLAIEKAWELADPLARLAAPFSRWLQAHATRLSLRRFRQLRA